MTTRAKPYDWTPERRAQADAMWNAGEPRQAILEAVGCTNWQWGKYRRQHLAPRNQWEHSRQHDISDEDFTLLWRTASTAEIAAHLGWPRTAVYGRSARMGLRRYRTGGRWTEQRHHRPTYTGRVPGSAPLAEALATLYGERGRVAANSIHHWHHTLTQDERDRAVWRARELAGIPHFPPRSHQPPTAAAPEPTQESAA